MVGSYLLRPPVIPPLARLQFTHDFFSLFIYRLRSRSLSSLPSLSLHGAGPPRPFRSSYTLLPPGYLESRGGTVRKPPSKGVPPNGIAAGGVAGAASTPASGSIAAVTASPAATAADMAPNRSRRWLLTDDQVLDDIKFMRVRGMSRKVVLVLCF